MFSLLQVREWWRIISHLPWWAFIYAGFLSAISAGSLSVYIYFDGDLPQDANDQMFLYITLIIAWLVTTRPESALDVHEKLTEQTFSVMRKLASVTKKIAKETPEKLQVTGKAGGGGGLKDSTYSALFTYIVTNVSSRPQSHKTKELSFMELALIENNEDYAKILKSFNGLQTKQRLALPAALHGMCVLLTFIFHTVFAPIVLYSHELSYEATIICNFILAFYTTGCLEVAIKLEHPFRDVTLTDENPPTKEFQVMYTEIFTVLKNVQPNQKNSLSPGNFLSNLLRDSFDFEIEVNSHYKKRDDAERRPNFKPYSINDSRV